MQVKMLKLASNSTKVATKTTKKPTTADIILPKVIMQQTKATLQNRVIKVPTSWLSSVVSFFSNSLPPLSLHSPLSSPLSFPSACCKLLLFLAILNLFNCSQLTCCYAFGYSYSRFIGPVAGPEQKIYVADGHSGRGSAADYIGWPEYEFSYGVEDANSRVLQNRKETRDGDAVKGVYSVVDPDGTLRVVKYTADNVNGFQAEVITNGIATIHGQSHNDDSNADYFVQAGPHVDHHVQHHEHTPTNQQHYNNKPMIRTTTTNHDNTENVHNTQPVENAEGDDDDDDDYNDNNDDADVHEANNEKDDSKKHYKVHEDDKEAQTNKEDHDAINNDDRVTYDEENYSSEDEFEVTPTNEKYEYSNENEGDEYSNEYV